MGPTDMPLSSSTLSSITAGASVVAAAAPTLCAVHCAAMPFVTAALPALQAAGRGQLLGGLCMHALGRRLAFYFVVPCGLLSNAVGYPQHQSIPVTATSLTGIATMTAAAAWRPVAAYRTSLNLCGCAMMIGSSYYGNQLAQEAGRDCCADSSSCCSDGGCK